MDLSQARTGSTQRLNFAALITAIVLVTLACQVNVGGPAPPGDPIPVSESAAEELTRTWESVLDHAVETGQIMVIITESQMTSFLAFRLAEQENPVLHDPQVYLQEGKLEIFGTTTQGFVRAHVLVSVVPWVTEDGSIAFAIQSADLGPLPAPEALKESLSALLTEAFTGSVGSLATGIRITSLAIDGGEMAVVGELR